jgi:hypothetical protein
VIESIPIPPDAPAHIILLVVVAQGVAGWFGGQFGSAALDRLRLHYPPLPNPKGAPMWRRDMHHLLWHKPTVTGQTAPALSAIGGGLGGLVIVGVVWIIGGDVDAVLLSVLAAAGIGGQGGWYRHQAEKHKKEEAA